MSISSRVPLYLGCLSLVILAVIHLVTHFMSPVVALNEDQENLLTLYNSVMFQMPSGQERTLCDIMNGYSLYFPILLIGLVALLSISAKNNVVLKSALRTALIILLTLIVITYLYMIIPPLIMMCFSAICFGLSLWRLGKS